MLKDEKSIGEEVRSPEREGMILENLSDYDSNDWTEEDMVREPLAYGIEKRQGEYTLEDYYAWPAEQRVELIDGVIYVMEAPYIVHQDIASIVHMSIYEHIRKRNGKCKVFEAPVDVQLCCDDKTMVQPDVLVVCDRDKIISRCVVGAPDFILEVISKSTRKKDMGHKLIKYREAGVREYWIMDPYKKILRVYDFTAENTIPHIYPLEGSVPVGIFHGELEIDLSQIAESVEEFGVC